MPTKRIRREREPLPTQYPAQFSVMVTAETDTNVRTIKRHRGMSLSAVMRTAVEIGLAEMIRRGDMEPPAKRVRRAATARRVARMAAGVAGVNGA